MKNSTTDQVKGKFNKVTGKIKEGRRLPARQSGAGGRGEGSEAHRPGAGEGGPGQEGSREVAGRSGRPAQRIGPVGPHQAKP